MGLFDSAIQNLSRMALNESGVEIPQVTAPALVDEFKATLDQIPSLTESEQVFPVYAVAIKESKRLGKYLIEMEDLSRYMLTNSITNILEAVSNIGNNNGLILNNSNVALVIDEASILQEMDDLGMNIGGSNSNEGNIGTVGLLGPHTDLGKFRRFANSREFIDTVCNKYGLPLVKKNYTIGLIPVKHKDIEHDGNLQESAAEMQAKKKGASQILQEKPIDKDKDVESLKEFTSYFDKSGEEWRKAALANPTGANSHPDFNKHGEEVKKAALADPTGANTNPYFNKSGEEWRKAALANAKPGDGLSTKFKTALERYKSSTSTTSTPSSAPNPFDNSPTNSAEAGKMAAFNQGFFKHLGGSIPTSIANTIYRKTGGDLALATKQYNASNVGATVNPMGAGRSSGSGSSPAPKTVTHASTQPDESLQYIRDIAYGKYDKELLDEAYNPSSFYN